MGGDVMTPTREKLLRHRSDETHYKCILLLHQNMQTFDGFLMFNLVLGMCSREVFINITFGVGGEKMFTICCREIIFQVKFGGGFGEMFIFSF